MHEVEATDAGGQIVVVTGTSLHTSDTQEVMVTTVVVTSVVVEGNGQ